eukprot:8551174-Pyramimonas_sp.AAC.1
MMCRIARFLIEPLRSVVRPEYKHYWNYHAYLNGKFQAPPGLLKVSAVGTFAWESERIFQNPA